MISFQCAECGAKYQVPEQHAGKRTRCKKCEAVLVIPAVEAAVDDEPAAPPPPPRARRTSSARRSSAARRGSSARRAAAQSEKTGGSNKAIVAVLVLLVVGVGGYFAYDHFIAGSGDGPAVTDSPSDGPESALPSSPDGVCAIELANLEPLLNQLPRFVPPPVGKPMSVADALPEAVKSSLDPLKGRVLVAWKTDATPRPNLAPSIALVYDGPFDRDGLVQALESEELIGDPKETDGLTVYAAYETGSEALAGMGLPVPLPGGAGAADADADAAPEPFGSFAVLSDGVFLVATDDLFDDCVAGYGGKKARTESYAEKLFGEPEASAAIVAAANLSGVGDDSFKLDGGRLALEYDGDSSVLGLSSTLDFGDRSEQLEKFKSMISPEALPPPMQQTLKPILDKLKLEEDGGKAKLAIDLTPADIAPLLMMATMSMRLGGPEGPGGAPPGFPGGETQGFGTAELDESSIEIESDSEVGFDAGGEEDGVEIDLDSDEDL